MSVKLGRGKLTELCALAVGDNAGLLQTSQNNIQKKINSTLTDKCTHPAMWYCRGELDGDAV